MNKWLRTNFRGHQNHTPDRWKKLNDAFGEGWEVEFGEEGPKTSFQVKWDARLVQVKAWVVRHGRYPGQHKTSKEASMFYWLRDNLPRKHSHTPYRWKKMNDAFGEGWEADFEKGSPSHLEAKWDARLVEVKAWVVRHRRYPVYNGTSKETSMYDWLRHNLPGKPSHTPARWKKLNDAFGEGWEAGFIQRRRIHTEEEA
jgi:hypothetical protein